MKIISKLKKNIIPLILLSILILQNGIWPFWSNGMRNSFVLIFILLLYIILRRGIVIRKCTFPCLFLALLVFFLLPLVREGILVGSSITNILLLIVIMQIKESEKIKVFGWLTTILALIISASLPLWLLNLYIYELPVFEQIDISHIKGNESTIMNNYIFFVTPVEGLNVFRFYSIFDEPGVLGTLSAMVLFGNRYNLKDKRNNIILIGAIFSFSIAFIFLTILGIMYFSRDSIKKMFSYILVGVIVILIAFFLLKDDLAFQNSVIDRIVNIGDEGTYQRTSDSFERMYEEYTNSYLYLVGAGEEAIKLIGESSSYKVFLYQYGLLGGVTLLMIYFSLTNKHNAIFYGALMIFAASFFQRPLAFYAWQIILFSIIISNLSDKKNIKTTN